MKMNFIKIHMIHDFDRPHSEPPWKGKTAKTAVLPGFCNIECAGCRSSTSAEVAIIWLSFLPKICRGGSDQYQVDFNKLYVLWEGIKKSSNCFVTQYLSMSKPSRRCFPIFGPSQNIWSLKYIWIRLANQCYKNNMS